MYRTAWRRELGGYLLNKIHEIDALVLTTRLRMREREEALEIARTASLRVRMLERASETTRPANRREASACANCGACFDVGEPRVERESGSEFFCVGCAVEEKTT